MNSLIKVHRHPIASKPKQQGVSIIHCNTMTSFAAQQLSSVYTACENHENAHEFHPTCCLSLMHQILHTPILHVICVQATSMSDADDVRSEAISTYLRDEAVCRAAHAAACASVALLVTRVAETGESACAAPASPAAHAVCTFMHDAVLSHVSTSVYALLLAWAHARVAVAASLRQRCVALDIPAPAHAADVASLMDSAATLERVLDAACSDAKSSTSIESARLYRAMMCLELQRMQSYVPLQARRELLAVFDFDDTLTCTDTTPMYARMATQAHDGDAVAQQAVQHAWAAAEIEYASMCMQVHVAALRSSAGASPTARVLAYMAATGAYDRAAVSAVSGMGITRGDGEQVPVLSGIPARQLSARSAFSDAVSLRTGVRSCLRLTAGARVLSLNWSRCFINTCLSSVGFDVQMELIHANDLQLGDLDGRSGACTTGVINASITSSLDKAVVLESMRPPAGCIFIGDSIGDLCALLAADVGVLVCKDSSAHECGGKCVRGRLVDVCALADVSVLPLACVYACKPAEPVQQVLEVGEDLCTLTMRGMLWASKRVIFIAASLDEVAAFLHAYVRPCEA